MNLYSFCVFVHCQVWLELWLLCFFLVFLLVFFVQQIVVLDRDWHLIRQRMSPMMTSQFENKLSFLLSHQCYFSLKIKWWKSFRVKYVKQRCTNRNIINPPSIWYKNYTYNGWRIVRIRASLNYCSHFGVDKVNISFSLVPKSHEMFPNKRQFTIES